MGRAELLTGNGCVWGQSHSSPFQNPSESRTKEHLPKPGGQKSDWRGHLGSAVPSGNNGAAEWFPRALCFLASWAFWIPSQVCSLHGDTHPIQYPYQILFPYQPQGLGRPALTLVLHNLALPTLAFGIIPTLLWPMSLDWNLRIATSWFQTGLNRDIPEQTQSLPYGPPPRNGSLVHFLIFHFSFKSGSSTISHTNYWLTVPAAAYLSVSTCMFWTCFKSHETQIK